ncbi:MAG: DUF4956 domain-containing protein [Phycisphaerae bacterium]|nr:DUF4956 domain-containing protein [Phycisphaerae bacterium]
MIDKIWNIINNNNGIGTSLEVWAVLHSLLLAFVLSQALAWIYSYTHNGLSYSKSFVQSLIVITMVVSLIMPIISGSFVVAVGLMGGLSIIRFRNIIKNTRDIAFLFCALVIGMACGTGKYGIACIGTFFLCLVFVYMHISDFGMRYPSNGFISFTSATHLDSNHPMHSTLKRFCRNFTLISSNSNPSDPNKTDYAYQVLVKNSTKNEQMISQIQDIQDISHLSLTMQEQLLEM